MGEKQNDVKRAENEAETGQTCSACGGARRERMTDDGRTRSYHRARIMAATPRADAIMAAVDKANNRAADAFRLRCQVNGPFALMSRDDYEAWLRSGADAPDAVTGTVTSGEAAK